MDQNELKLALAEVLPDMLAEAIAQRPYSVAAASAVAAKKLESSAAIGGQALTKMREVFALVDSFVQVRDEANGEQSVIDARLTTLIQSVAELASTEFALTAKRHEILDPILSAIGYVPKV